MGKKLNNTRRHPGESSRCRPDRAAARREEALTRQSAHDKLSTSEKIQKLDIKFGVGQGAKKERKRLLSTKLTDKVDDVVEIANKSLPDEILSEIEAINNENSSKKKTKAKERRLKNQKKHSNG